MSANPRVGTMPRFIFALLASAGFASMAASQTPVWTNNWIVQAPPSLFPSSFVLDSPTAAIAFGSNGDVLLGGPPTAYNDLQIVRMDSAGAPRWSVHVSNSNFGYHEGYYGTGALVATADGGAFATVGNVGGTTLLLRIDASGSIQWSRQLPAWTLAAPSPQTMVTAGCGVVTGLDAETGSTVWQYTGTGGLYCVDGGLVADDQGNVYATFLLYSISNGVVSGNSHVLKLDGAGHVLWDAGSSEDNIDVPSPVGTSSGLLFLNTNSGVSALRLTDGSVAWNVPQASIQALVGNPLEPMVSEGNSILRLAASNGQPRWTQAVQGTIGFATFVSGRVLLSTTSGLLGVDPATGSTSWTGQLLAHDASGNYLTLVSVGARDANTLTAVSSALNPSNNLGAPPVFLQTLNAQNGQLLASGSATAIAQGIGYEASSSLEDPGHIATAAITQSASAPQVLVRRLDATTGAQLWESQQAFNGELVFPMIDSANGLIVVVAPENTYPSYGATWVGAFEDASGNLRWQKTLYDTYETYTSAPVIDMDGNGDVYVSYGAFIPCPYGYVSTYGCTEQVLVKLSAIDGSQIWRFDNFPEFATQSSPLEFSVIGSDVIVTGPFTGALSSAGTVRLSGIDGSVQWSSESYESYVFPNGDLIAFFPGSWAKLDPASGDILWSNTSTPAVCTGSCYSFYGYDALQLPGDGLLFASEYEYRPLLSYLPGSPNSMETDWTLEPNDPALRSQVLQAQRDSAGNLWLQLRRKWLDQQDSGFSLLAGFDLQTGSLLGQQVVSTSAADPVAPTMEQVFLAAPENNRLTMYTTAFNSPAPTTSGSKMLDVTVLAHGDLSLQVTADHSLVHTGDTINFHIVATYAGDAAISGVTLFGSMPWMSGVTGATCATQSAANCEVDTRSGNLRASFDLQPNGTVDIAGQVRVLNGMDGAELEAYIAGPISLSEPNTLNNFSRVGFAQSLFRDGFE